MLKKFTTRRNIIRNMYHKEKGDSQMTIAFFESGNK